MANRIPKYRPSLTGEQINHLISLCRKDSSNESLRIIGVLAEFEHKIRNGAVVPSHAVDVKNPLSVDLGFSEMKTAEAISIEQLYKWWQTDPGLLNIEQLSRVREYRYVNDLMDVAEELQYGHEIYESPTSQG